MRFSRGFLLFLAVIILTHGHVLAQDPPSTSSVVDSEAQKPLKIVPIVSLKPGETKKLLLSTHCTVGLTRGGGFGLTEMRNGVAEEGQTKGYDKEGASYRRDGVVIRVPAWDAATDFAASTPYASLKEAGIAVFEVTVSASERAKPGLFEMHLVDATCSGNCATDFRVFVIPE